jgi:predicted ATPase
LRSINCAFCIISRRSGFSVGGRNELPIPRGTMKPYFVITGGPGAGKTSLIDALSRARFPVAPEAGRRVIREQQRINGHALPWVDSLAFAEAMLACDLAFYREFSGQTGPVFFDRGIPDIVGYLRLENMAVPQNIRNAAANNRYQRCVFICPPWPEIYRTDTERRQSFGLAVRTYDAMLVTYSEFGYELVEVPRDSVEARVRFVSEAAAHALAAGR